MDAGVIAAIIIAIGGVIAALMSRRGSRHDVSGSDGSEREQKLAVETLEDNVVAAWRAIRRFWDWLANFWYMWLIVAIFILIQRGCG